MCWVLRRAKCRNDRAAFVTAGHDAALRNDLDHRPGNGRSRQKQGRNTNAESDRRSSNLPFGRLSLRVLSGFSIPPISCICALHYYASVFLLK
jgi:hypothetical protein